MTHRIRKYTEYEQMPEHIFDECYVENLGCGGGLKGWLRQWREGTPYVVYVLSLYGHVVSWAMAPIEPDGSTEVYIWTVTAARRVGYGSDLVRYIEKDWGGRQQCYKCGYVRRRFWDKQGW